MDSESMAVVTANLGLENPIESGEAPFYVLIETSGSNSGSTSIFDNYSMHNEIPLWRIRRDKLYLLYLVILLE